MASIDMVEIGNIENRCIINKQTCEAALSRVKSEIDGLNNEAQADERVFGETDRGAEFALAALDIAASGLRLARYLEELDRDDIERERNEEIFGSNFLHDEDDDDDDVPGGFSLGNDNPFKN